MDRGQNTATHRQHRPLLLRDGLPARRSGLVMEAYNDSFYTTGVTYQADNQPTPTTVKGAGVDVSVLPDHRSRRPARLGRARLRPDRRQRGRPAQRRHRRLDQLRHDPQRARPAVRRGRGLAAGCLRCPGRAVRARRLRARRRRPVRRERRLRARPGRLLRHGQAAQHLRLRALEPADRLRRPRRRRQPAGPRRRRERAGAQPGHGRRVHLELPAERAVRPLRDRPGHPRRQLRRCRGRQLRLRRRLLRPARSTPRDPGQPRSASAARSTPLRRG